MSSEPLEDSADGTIVQNENEELRGQRRPLDITRNPQLQLHVKVLPQHYVSGKENLGDQQRNSTVEQEDPEPSQIKEEQDNPEYQQIKEEHKELCISQDEEQLDLKREIETLMETPTYKAPEEQAKVLDPPDIHTPPPPPQAEAAVVPDGDGTTATTTAAARRPDSFTSLSKKGGEQQQEQEITPPSPSSGNAKGRGRKRKEKSAAAAKPKKDWSIEEKVEEEILKWLQANPYLWMRSKKGYKRKKAAWEMKAAELGISEGHLECWWKGVKDWHVKLIKKRSDQATKIHTERENWVLKNVAFYKSSIPKKGGDPQVPLARQPSQSSQASATVSKPPDSDQKLEASGSNVLEELEAAAMPSTQTSSRQGSHSDRHDKRKREEQCLEEEDTWMALLRSTMKANQTLLEKLLEERPVHTEREAFIRFVSDTLRTVPEEDYAEMKNLILDIVSHRRQQPAQSSQPQPSTSWSRPELQPSSQHFNQNFQQQQHYFQPQSTQYTQS